MSVRAVESTARALAGSAHAFHSVQVHGAAALPASAEQAWPVVDLALHGVGPAASAST
jgi:hypothetical protein